MMVDPEIVTKLTCNIKHDGSCVPMTSQSGYAVCLHVSEQPIYIYICI